MLKFIWDENFVGLKIINPNRLNEIPRRKHRGVYLRRLKVQREVLRLPGNCKIKYTAFSDFAFSPDSAFV